MAVRLAPDSDGVISLDAEVIGASTADITAPGMGFVARGDERCLGFAERSNAVDQHGNDVENDVGGGPYPQRLAAGGDLPDGSV